jgi:hypothetical protein
VERAPLSFQGEMEGGCDEELGARNWVRGRD